MKCNLMRILLCVVAPCVAQPARADESASAAASEISYYKQIRPIFQAHCQGCHQPAKAGGAFVMTEHARLVAGGESGMPAIVPGKVDESYLIEMITPQDGKAEMPRGRPPLNGAEIELVKQWIAAGAVDDTPAGARQKYDQDRPPIYTRPPVITSLDFSPDGQVLAVSGFHEVLLVRGDGSELIARLVGVSERIESVKFSPDGKRLAAAGGLPGRMGEVQIWDIETRKLKLSVPITYDTVYGAKWSPDGKLVSFGCSDNSVRAIDASTGEQVLFQGAHTDWVRDTVFSSDGSHLVSVARDMTAKLTEVATQRFVDNVTSITPGALKGGIMSVARHPQRDEIVIGGSDGVPKVYRMHRVTNRVIGDDANIIRELPAMKGRIFGVAVSGDGRRIAAGSSLDGSGEVFVYSFEFDTALPENIKKIVLKVVTTQTAEEKATLKDYLTSDVRVVARTEVPASPIYTVSFHPDGQLLAAAGADGVIRLIDPESGRIQSQFAPAPIGERAVAARGDGPAQPDAVPQPQELAGYQPASPEPSGAAALVAQSAEPVAATPSAADRGHADFIRDVAPLLSRLGCNQGTCHGSAQGRNGFKLSLRGYDPLFDVRALTDDLASRRVNQASPDESLILLKSTATVPHAGGKLLEPGEPYYQTIRDWIVGGARLDATTPRVTKIDIFPQNPVIESIGQKQPFRVMAVYGDGATREVTREAFIESGNSEVAAAAPRGGMLTAVRRGEAPVLARYEGAYAATTLTVMGDRTGFTWEVPESWGRIDELVAAKWQRMKIRPSQLCGDSEFLRRVYLDLIGLPPTADDVRAFMADSTETRAKRAALVDRLIGSDAFVEHWTNKWADLLQVNRKFLGAEGAAAFRGWIRQQIAENTPYDQFVKRVLTANGSNRENPPAAYYKVLRDPASCVENTTHLFLAIRFNCNKCHDHPFERWTQDQYYELSAFFARVKLERDPASGGNNIGGTAVEGARPLFEIVSESAQGEVEHQRTNTVAQPKLPFDCDFSTTENATRRDQLAAWITSPHNPYFARSFVNRVWGYLLGVGLVEPIDDIRAGNPPTNPDLLDHLTQEFVQSGFDTRHVIRLICQSRTYQLSIESNRWNEDDRVNFSHAAAKRLPAEVLYDTVHRVTGSISKLPGVKPGTRAAELPDAGVDLPSGFFTTFGRPARESACECERTSTMQLGPVMALVSGPTIASAIADPENELAKLAAAESDDRKLVNEVFLRIVNRPASDAEIDATLQAMQRIETDHQALTASLQAREEYLRPIRVKLEQQRDAAIAKAKDVLAAYEMELAPKLVQQERERAEREAKLAGELADYQQTLDPKLEDARRQQPTAIAWQTLEPKSIKASNGAALTHQPDGSVTAELKDGPAVYNFVAETDLKDITGIRLEVLADDALPGRGPGLAPNGNFVITEFELKVAPKGARNQQKPVKLQNPAADFSQQSFDIAAAIDGNRGGNNGWAGHPQTGLTHWATFELAEPIGHDGGSVLNFAIDQRFPDNKHLVGRFRISVTRAPKPFKSTYPAQLGAILALSPDSRSDTQQAEVLQFYRSRDEEYRKKQIALADAKRPLPTDPKLIELREQLETASRPIPPDAKLVQLQKDTEQSTQQMANKRLTAMQDLAWALINSPEFLFNH